jgi:hypothetical protein
MRDGLTWCSAIMVELQTRKGEMASEDENNIADTSRNEKSGI